MFFKLIVSSEFCPPYLHLRTLNMDTSPISLFVEIPEALHGSLVGFLENRPDWDQDRVFSAAISLFLLQNRSPEQGSDRQAARIYLDSIFRRPADAAST